MTCVMTRVLAIAVAVLVTSPSSAIIMTRVIAVVVAAILAYAVAVVLASVLFCLVTVVAAVAIPAVLSGQRISRARMGGRMTGTLRDSENRIKVQPG